MKNCQPFHFRYIPILLFLLGLKICLLFFLVTSIHPDDAFQKSVKLGQHIRTNSTTFSQEESALKLNGKKVGRRKKATSHKSTTAIPRELLEEWDTLAHLENAKIKPTHTNRYKKQYYHFRNEHDL